MSFVLSPTIFAKIHKLVRTAPAKLIKIIACKNLKKKNSEFSSGTCIHPKAGSIKKNLSLYNLKSYVERLVRVADTALFMGQN